MTMTGTSELDAHKLLQITALRIPPQFVVGPFPCLLHADHFSDLVLLYRSV
jgi:hypothetical protein